MLAQQAIGQLQVPTPVIGVGPDREKLAVNLWTWLWVDDPGALSTTVSAGGISVTATATLSEVAWNLGEPDTDSRAYTTGPAVTVTCTGAGIAPPDDFDWKAEPPCGHMFRWRSDPARTNGTGAWPVQVTTTWDVTWQSNTGVTGSTTLSGTAADAFEVGEYRILLVPPGS